MDDVKPDIMDRILDWYAANVLAAGLEEGNPTPEDEYRAETQRQIAENIFREISHDVDRLTADGAVLLRDGARLGFYDAAIQYDRQRLHTADEAGCDTCREYEAEAERRYPSDLTKFTSFGERVRASGRATPSEREEPND